MFSEMTKAAQVWQQAVLGGAQMMMAAGTVIQIRTLQMAFGTMQPREAARMIFEKPTAFAQAGQGAALALMTSQGAAAAALAAIQPIGKAAGANARRLSRASAPGRKR